MKVYELLTPETWIQGEYARDVEGHACATWDDDAVQWCLVGALKRCYHVPGYSSVVEPLYARLSEQVGVQNLEAWNDAPERSFEEVYTVVVMLGI